MKKFLFVIVGLLTGSCLIAQTTLTFESHALKAEHNNPMTYCEYINPGPGGTNQVWDFSTLKAEKEFTGLISKANESEFLTSNTVLEEFGVKFYFNVSEEGIEQYGYASESGRSQIKYTRPFEKIRYPFSYSDAYTSTFAADYLSDNVVIGQIDGSAFLVADAWGTLQLPGGAEYKNTLRVMTEKEYTLSFENSNQDVKMLTYRWYNSTHRYPLLVLTEIETRVNNNVIRTRTQAAYNSNAVTLISSSLETGLLSDVSVYPNPASNHLTLTFEAKSNELAHMVIIDMNGREIYKEEYTVVAGINLIQLDETVNRLPEGVYLLNIQYEGVNKQLEFSVKR